MDSSYFNKGAHSAQELLFQVCHGGLSIVVNDLSLKLAWKQAGQWRVPVQHESIIEWQK